MLLQLMQLIRNSGSIDINRLAHQLDVTPRQVMMMLEDLERLGKVHQTDFCQTGGCNECPSGSSCNQDRRSTRIWSFEES